MTRSRFLLVMIASLIAGFTGLNLLARATLEGARIDLTERGLYALSDGTRTVLSRLDEPVSLTFYYSRSEAAAYPAIRAYGARVRELLRAIRAEAGGGVRLEEVDPGAFTPEEDAAIRAGLEAAPTDGGGQIFFGLVGRNAVDDQRVIRFFDPNDEAQLEYAIVRVIAELERARAPRLAIISDLPFAPDQTGLSANPVIAELAAAFELDWLEPDFETIPSAADALLLLHPPQMSDAQLYLVDQFALTKGRVLAVLDPMAHIALKPGPDGLPPLNASRASDLPRLLAGWGALYDPNTVAMDAETGLPVQIVEAGRARMRAYPLWFAAPAAGMNRDLPAVAGLSRGVNFGSPGVLRPAPGSTAEFTPLIQSSPGAARLDADEAAASPSPEDLMRDYAPAGDAPLVLGALLSGRFETAFADGPPASEILLDDRRHQDISTSAGEIILLADADLLDPAFFLRADPVQGEQIVADNLALILNLTDRLAGDPALVSLRSRASSARPMVRVDRLRADAEARYLELQDALQLELTDAEARLDALTRAGRASALGGATAADADEAAALREEILEARERLREIERGFRVEIDALENRLMILTVWVPALGVGLIAALVLLTRRRRRL